MTPASPPPAAGPDAAATDWSDARTLLVINCGSSSLKYEVWRLPQRDSLGRGLVERIGEAKGSIAQKTTRGELKRELVVPNHKTAMALVVEALLDPTTGVLKERSEIAAIGHRVVHGGEKYANSVLIDPDVIAAVEAFAELAPLHNPPNLTGIRAAQEQFPGLPQVAVFDTAFHQTMPAAAYLYGLPRELYDKFRIRRYGFHGTSHRFVAARALELLKRSPENTNVISCHLGNGASVTAIEKGRSIDTSMGFTPLEGLIMGTRSGDIDPAIVLYLLDRGYSVKDLNNLLNKKSGLIGMSGISNDLRDLERASSEGNARASEALEAYAYRVRKYIGGYAANLVKVDSLVFTGGIGQYGWKMRERICHRLENIGIYMDYHLNQIDGAAEGVVSAPHSPVTILVVPTNEELQIAIDTYEICFAGETGFYRRKSDVNM